MFYLVSHPIHWTLSKQQSYNDLYFLQVIVDVMWCRHIMCTGGEGDRMYEDIFIEDNFDTLHFIDQETSSEGVECGWGKFISFGGGGM